MKKILVGSAASAAGLGLAGAGAAAYVNRMVQGRATGDLQGFLDRNSSDPVDPVVFLGDSIVRGRASVDFVDLLRPKFPNLELINGGENGDLSYDTRERLVHVVSTDPVGVVIMIGTNDARAMLMENSNEVARRTQNHPQPPSLAFFSENLQRILDDLSTHTHAAIGVCSLPPLGEKIESEANLQIRQFNNVISDLTAHADATYIPVYEALLERLHTTEGLQGRDFQGSWRFSASSLTQHFLIGRSFDQIASRNGYALTPDGMHLNSTAAEIVAEAVEKFLATITPHSAAAPEE